MVVLMRIDERAIQPIAVGPAGAAELLGLGVTRTRELIASGAIPHLTCGRRVLLRVSDLIRFIDAEFERQRGGGQGR